MTTATSNGVAVSKRMTVRLYEDAQARPVTDPNEVLASSHHPIIAGKIDVIEGRYEFAPRIEKRRGSSTLHISRTSTRRRR